MKRIVQASPGAVNALWRRPEGIAIQYAESWGLVHYLLLERKDRNPGAFGRFLTAVEAGTDPTRALEEAFATTLAKLDSELKPYLTQRLSYLALSVPLAASGLFPPAAQQMLRVGEETGTLARQLVLAANFYRAELTQRVKRLTTLFEPAVILVMGGIVGFVAVALVSAMYGIFNQVKT